MAAARSSNAVGIDFFTVPVEKIGNAVMTASTGGMVSIPAHAPPTNAGTPA